MIVTLLGTGSADGWPNPFCTCASCLDALSNGEIRGQSSALVDHKLLIDCGPEVPRAAVRHGVQLADVRYLFFTHAHPDHVGPMALLFRRWAGAAGPLTIVGPPAVLELLAPWIGPDEPISCVCVRPGQTIETGGYLTRVLAATHDDESVGPAVLFDITGPDKHRLLYAADTGPLKESVHRALADAQFDIALIEQTFGDTLDHGTDHLDLATFAQTVARLRLDKALMPESQVFAIHLSHHNPPSRLLAERMAACQVGVAPDGTTIVAGEPAELSMLPQRTLILGGARSGKSLHAERLLAAEPVVTYVATAALDDTDEQWMARIAAHRARRPAGWRTVETIDVAGMLTAATPGEFLLIDCLTLWLTRTLDECSAWDGDTTLAMKRMSELVQAWRSTSARVVAVSNEVGLGVVPATSSGRLFRDMQGMLNAKLAAVSDASVMMVAGRAVQL